MQRTVTGEHLDDPQAPSQELADSLAHIRHVNARLGGTEALLRHLRAWSHRWPAGRPITLLDLGTGSADIPLAARRWALSQGIDLRITALDNHPTILDLAREHVAGADGITLVQADALDLRRLYGAGSFDYVHAGMFLHHLRDLQVLTVLAAMDRIARAGLVWNDLRRSHLALAAVKVLTLRATPMVKHDAQASIRAAFTPADVAEFRARAGLGYCRFRSSFWTQRFTLAGEKPGVWD